MWFLPRSYGPLTLTIHLDASADAIVRCLATLGPSPYVLESAGRYHHPGHERGPMLLVRDRALKLVRSYPSPAPEVVAYDADVLAALVGGALGELTWDLVDEEYFQFDATGEDAASLAEYLSPACDRTAIEAHRDRMFALRTCDARAAATPEQALRIVAGLLGAPADLDAVTLAAWFAASAPRNLEVIAPRELETRFGTRWYEPLQRPRARLSIAYR